jgi:hypothetical protein
MPLRKNPGLPGFLESKIIEDKGVASCSWYLIKV